MVAHVGRMRSKNPAKLADLHAIAHDDEVDLDDPNLENIVLSFHTRVGPDPPTENSDMIADVARVGTGNMTVRASEFIRKEDGIHAELVDFSIGGIKIESSKSFLEYVLGNDYGLMDFEEQVQILENTCYMLNFYPKLRFNRKT